MVPPVRLVVALSVVVLVGAAVFAGARYQAVQAVQDRLATAYTIGEANFSTPGLLTWPRLTQDGAWAQCDYCPAAGSSGTTAEYGILTSDPGLAAFRSNASNLPNVAGQVSLPRVVWILQWAPMCDVAAVPHTIKCATFELIDDATGWVLDTG